jgi:hypothetical protein
MISLVGFLLLGHILQNMQGDIDTASKVFYSGLSMGWINILVSIVIPDASAIGSGFAEIVSTLTMACVLQVRLPTPCLYRTHPVLILVLAELAGGLPRHENSAGVC